MPKGIFPVPVAKNEPVWSYAPGTAERNDLKRAIEEARSTEIEVPMYIGSEEIKTDNKYILSPPHDHQHILGYFHRGDESHVDLAVNAALGAKPSWDRAASTASGLRAKSSARRASGSVFGGNSAGGASFNPSATARSTPMSVKTASICFFSSSSSES